MPITTRRTRALLVGATALIASLALTGCSALSTLLGGAPRDETGQVTETVSDTVFNLRVGDCFNEPEGAQVNEVELVPCSEPHDKEVYAELTLPDGDLPDDVKEQADEFCYNEFEPFIGVSYEESTLYYRYFFPSQDTWDYENDRLITCIVYDSAGQTTGSLAGSNK